MKIGYPCVNWTIDCQGNKTFRLKSYSEKRLIETVENNLNCLIQMLQFNITNNLFFFRITSDLVPFASHPICTFNWKEYFKKTFEKIGKIIQDNNIRISMHPDQFIVLNSKNPNVVKRSIAELSYHADILDLMQLNKTAKIQLHAGGAYGDKEKSLHRFATNFKSLSDKIKKRLVIENDDKIYSFRDCLFLHHKINVPLLFDVFHHQILNNDESLQLIFEKQKKTWKKIDGIPMVDYSSQKQGYKAGSHAETIDVKDFKRFLKASRPYDFDIMLEIKDKETSALKAVKIAKEDERLMRTELMS